MWYWARVWRYATRSTGLGYGGMRCGPDIAYGVIGMPVGCYGLAYAGELAISYATSLRAPYAMLGTDSAYRASRWRGLLGKKLYSTG